MAGFYTRSNFALGVSVRIYCEQKVVSSNPGKSVSFFFFFFRLQIVPHDVANKQVHFLTYDQLIINHFL